MIWLTPSSASGSGWYYHENAIDGSLATRAIQYVGVGGTSDDLVFTLPEAMLCSTIRVYVSATLHNLKFKTWIYTGSWEYLGENITWNGWVHRNIRPYKVITQARITVTCYSAADTAWCQEFQVEVWEPYAVTGSGGLLKSGEATIDWEGGTEAEYEVTGSGGTTKSGMAAIEADEDVSEIQLRTLIDLTVRDDCVALYRFEEGFLTHDSIGKNTLTAHEDPVADTTNYKEGSASLDLEATSKQYLSIADSDLSDNFLCKSGTTNRTGTILLWMRPESGKWYNFLVTKYNKSYQRSICIGFITPTYFGIYLCRDGTDVIDVIWYHLEGDGFTCDGAHWYHVAIVFEESNGKTNYRIRIYDATAGQLLDDDVTGAWDYLLNVGTSDFTVGGFNGDYSWTFDGLIDDFAVYNTALAVTDIDSIRENGNLEFITRRLSQEDREFPATNPKFYEGLIVNSGDIESRLSNMYYGARTISDYSFSLSNVEGEITSLMESVDLRGMPMTVKKVDIASDEIIEQNKFTITDIKFNLTTAEGSAQPEDLDALEVTLPKGQINSDNFPNAIPESMGKPINVCFGMASDVPLYCIGEDTNNDFYDHLIGHGIISEVLSVYREGNGTKTKAFSDTVCNGTATSTSTMKLIDSSATFITDGIQKNMQVENTTDTTYTFVVSVDSETQLTVRDDIFVSADGYSIGAEYIFYDGSQQTPYPGYAFLRFPLEQRDGNGNILNLTANVSGIKIGDTQEERGIAILKETLTNMTWGLGLVVNEDSFDDALAALGDDYTFGGGFFEFKRAAEWIDMMLLGCKLAQLSKGINGYEVYIPQHKDISVMNFDEHEMNVHECSVRRLSEYVKEIVFNYKFGQRRVATGKVFGEIREYYSPFTVSVADAEVISTLLCNRFVHQDKIIRFATGKKGMKLRVHDVIKISHETFNIVNQLYEITDIVRRANECEVEAAEHNSDIFTES